MFTKWLAVVDLLKQLVETQSKTDGQYVYDFLESLWYAFSRVHEDYKASFQSYRSFFSPASLTDDGTADKLLNQMREDSAASQDIRSELQGILKQMPSPGKGSRDQKIHHLGRAILEYFQIGNRYSHFNDAVLLNIRATLISRLEHPTIGDQDDENTKFENLISKNVEDVVRSASEHIHKAHSSVVDAYHDLRAELLRTK